MRDEGIDEGTSRGKPVYYVFFDKGNVEITFDKATLKYMRAMSLFNDPDMEDYNSRELKQFREDYPGYYEWAQEMLAEYIAEQAAKTPSKKAPAKKTPAKKTPAKKKAIRRSRT